MSETVLQRCERAMILAYENGEVVSRSARLEKFAPEMVMAVVDTIFGLTGSPRTVDELTRIKNGATADDLYDAISSNGDGEDTTRAFTGEAVGAYTPGFFDRMNVLQLCGGDAIRAEMAWAWLNKTDAS